MVLPHKIATLLYCFDSADRLLLLERTQEPNLGKWSPPGGKVHVLSLIHISEPTRRRGISDALVGV